MEDAGELALIRINLGNVGSGKTLSMVREMYLNPQNTYYTNITPTVHFPNLKIIKGSDIILKEEVGEKQRTKEKIYKYSLNTEFWKAQPKPLTVVIDEAHTLINSRRSMSKINIILSDFLSLIRRITNSPLAEGELVVITQFLGRVDVNIREMASQVRYHREHYVRRCYVHGILRNKYTGQFWENSDFPKDKKMDFCPYCGKGMIKCNQLIEVWHFGGDAAVSAEENFYYWKFKKEKRFYDHYYIRDGYKYWNMYSTFQWDNMFSEFYD
jgi:hypothetical protein